MQQNTIKHTRRRVGRDSIRIAFQLPSPYPEKPYKVWRIRTVHQDHLFLLEGLVLEPANNGGPAVVAHVRAGDVVMVTHHPENGVTPPHRGFFIGQSLEPVPLADLAPYATNQTITNGPLMDYDGTGFLHFREDDLREFFRSKHPDWLEKHVDATLRVWRTEAPDLFANVAPTRWLTRKPWLLATHDPKRALTEFPHLIKGDLGRYCIRRMTAPASRILARLLPSKLKPFQSYQNAEFLLENHVNDLTDEQLRACARANPIAALKQLSRTIESRHRAILLSCSFGATWTNPTLLHSEDFRCAVLDSLADHFTEWMISKPEGLATVLDNIAVRLQLPPTAAEIVRMLDRLGPEGRQALSDYIAQQV
jgi:hypothetical protein